ncbi:MAG: stoA [Phycisphaerales bacterium]|nr:stoA [Phycisphaerales bacterium]
MRSPSLAAAAALLLTLAGNSFAQSTQPATLKVGDPAPLLTVGKWVKGEPVTKIEPGKIYVLDFWATWCVPCRAAMPHMTELAKKYPDMIVIAQNVWEDDVDMVKPFVDEMGDKLGYRVVLDDLSKPGRGAMADGWLDAAGKTVIPTVIVVGKDSKIAWVGHPMELDPVLEQIAADKFDPKAAATTQAREETLNQQIAAAVKAKDVDAVLAGTKELAALRPSDADSIGVFEFNVLSRNGRPDAARVRADGVARTSKNPQALNTLAWALATQPTPQPADLKIARVAIDRANEIAGNKESDYLDTSARIYALEKDWPKAVAVVEQALRIAESNAKASLQKSLDAYNKQEVPVAE